MNDLCSPEAIYSHVYTAGTVACFGFLLEFRVMSLGMWTLDSLALDLKCKCKEWS